MICFLGFASSFSHAQITGQIQAKLLEAEKNQAEIFTKLAEIRSELEVVKIRVSMKLGKKQP